MFRPLCSDSAAAYRRHDLALCMLTSGLMVRRSADIRCVVRAAQLQRRCHAAGGHLRAGPQRVVGLQRYRTRRPLLAWLTVLPAPCRSQLVALLTAPLLSTCSLPLPQVDFSLSCASLSVDEGRNSRAYGAGITAEALLRGDVSLPAACEALASRLAEAEGRAAAAAFEPSTRSQDYW